MTEHPLITGGGKIVRSYMLGPHQVVIVKDPASIGPIKYRYVAMVSGADNKEAILTVTAEQNVMFGLQKESKAFFLGVFSHRGRANLGASEDWGDLEKFETRALQIIRSELRIDSVPSAPHTSANASTSATRANWPRRTMYAGVGTVFTGLSWACALLAIGFFAYVLIAHPKEFLLNVTNPLLMLYFLPAIVCYWVADWARKKGRRC